MRIKKCTACYEKKPLSKFGKHSGSKDGYQCMCKRCLNRVRRNQRLENQYIGGSPQSNPQLRAVDILIAESEQFIRTLP